jgi:hypothetical protein
MPPAAAEAYQAASFMLQYGIIFLPESMLSSRKIMARITDTPKSGDATPMQENNATGADQNEQGQASFTERATTGGGSDFGQGSLQSGGTDNTSGHRRAQSGSWSSASFDEEGV